MHVRIGCFIHTVSNEVGVGNAGAIERRHGVILVINLIGNDSRSSGLTTFGSSYLISKIISSFIVQSTA